MTDKPVENEIETYSYILGDNPVKDAWYAAVFIENHIDYFSFPYQVATPEQIGFIVHSDDEQYFPCCDAMLKNIMDRNRNNGCLKAEYGKVYERILALIDEQIEEKPEKDYLKELIRIKFTHETRDYLMIPSRLEKRLVKIFLNCTQIADPWRKEKEKRNRRVKNAVNSAAFKKAMDHVDPADLTGSEKGLAEIRERLNVVEFKKLLSLTVSSSIWMSDDPAVSTRDDFLSLLNKPVTGEGLDPLLDFLGIRVKGPRLPKKILWLACEAGEIIADIAVIRYLTKLGHKIIISFTNGPFYTMAGFYDAEEEKVLSKALEGAFIIKDKILSKNELVKILKHDTNILVISDGTMEPINLLLTSTSFARVFKEVDGVISRGAFQKKRFFHTHFEFTQDIYNISEGEESSVSVSYKPRHPSVIKFSHHDLEKMAKAIIVKMQDARKKGKTVIFYSGIIGSIPGKIEMAKKIMSTFIHGLENQLSKPFIINPSEYYEPGMDADDLMYMWEIVQRSGHIDIWRFQSYEDISRAFKLMEKKVPPEWVGKDATYSTGCTKEMRIALSVLKKHPEMQIIGPSREKFMRRDAYGIGKMYDQRLTSDLS